MEVPWSWWHFRESKFKGCALEKKSANQGQDAKFANLAISTVLLQHGREQWCWHIVYGYICVAKAGWNHGSRDCEPCKAKWLTAWSCKSLPNARNPDSLSLRWVFSLQQYCCVMSLTYPESRCLITPTFKMSNADDDRYLKVWWRRHYVPSAYTQTKPDKHELLLLPFWRMENGGWDSQISSWTVYS